MLAHGLPKEEHLGVWGRLPQAGAAWDKLSVELEDATATDPLASGWAAEEVDVKEEEGGKEEEMGVPPAEAQAAARVEAPPGSAGGGSVRSAATPAAGAPAPDAALQPQQPATSLAQVWWCAAI